MPNYVTFPTVALDVETEAKALVAMARRVQTASGGALVVSLDACVAAVASAQERSAYVGILEALTYIANQLTVIRGAG